MEQEQPVSKPQQICTIRIMFPVDTDDDAIVFKKKFGAVVSEIRDAHVEFTLRTVPMRRADGPPV